jgi:hypothetical protein
MQRRLLPTGGRASPGSNKLLQLTVAFARFAALAPAAEQLVRYADLSAVGIPSIAPSASLRSSPRPTALGVGSRSVLTFEWDAEKAASNLVKHGVSFPEAATAFGDPLSMVMADPDHSGREDRWLLLGMTFEGRLVVVAHAERRETIRLISARLATRRERQDYERP